MACRSDRCVPKFVFREVGQPAKGGRQLRSHGRLSSLLARDGRPIGDGRMAPAGERGDVAGKLIRQSGILSIRQVQASGSAGPCAPWKQRGRAFASVPCHRKRGIPWEVRSGEKALQAASRLAGQCRGSLGSRLALSCSCSLRFASMIGAPQRSSERTGLATHRLN